MERQNYTGDQAETVKEALRWQMIPTEASEKILLAQEYGVSDSSRKAAAEEIDRLKGDGEQRHCRIWRQRRSRTCRAWTTGNGASLWQLQNKIPGNGTRTPFICCYDKRMGPGRLSTL